MEIATISLLVLGVIGGVALALLSRNSSIALDRNTRDKLKEMSSLFRQARKHIMIATDFDGRFFDTQRVKDSITEAVQNGAEVTFVAEAEPPEWYRGQQGIRIERVEKLPRHVMVIDDCCVRLERPHTPLTFGQGRSDVALIFKGFPALAQREGEEFAKWLTLKS